MNNLAKSIAALCLITAMACGDAGNLERSRRTVIKVDHHVLTLSKFNEFFESVKMNYEKDDVTRLRDARARYVLQLLEEMLIARRAEELGISVPPRELNEAIAEVKQTYTEEGFNDMLMKQAISLDTWKERLQKQLLVQKVIVEDLGKDIVVSREDIRRYFDEHKQEWHHPESFRVLHILVSEKKKAQKILKEVKNGADFSELARTYSTALEAESGGDMGYIEKGDLPEELEKPIFALKTNEVSPVIHTAFGYHIFKIIEKRPAGNPAMEELVEDIKKQVKNQKIKDAYGSWLSGLRTRYNVEINEQVI